MRMQILTADVKEEYAAVKALHVLAGGWLVAGMRRFAAEINKWHMCCKKA